jgi:uncharacterized protein (DUF2342 family)
LGQAVVHGALRQSLEMVQDVAGVLVLGDGAGAVDWANAADAARFAAGLMRTRQEGAVAETLAAFGQVTESAGGAVTP